MSEGLLTWCFTITKAIFERFLIHFWQFSCPKGQYQKRFFLSLQIIPAR